MREPNPMVDLEEPVFDRRVGVLHAQTERLGRPLEQDGITERLRGSHEEEQLRFRGKAEQAPLVALLDLAAQRLEVVHAESAGEPGSVPAAGELDERERVATTLRDDLIADRGIQGARHVLEQERACVTAVQPIDRELRKAGEDVIADARARSPHDRDSLRAEPPSGEAR